jgi:hypothetical protein
VRVYEVGKSPASLDWSVILDYGVVYFLVIREERTCTDARWYLLHSLDLHRPAKASQDFAAGIRAKSNAHYNRDSRVPTKLCGSGTANL